MTPSAQWINNSEYKVPETQDFKRLSFLKFLFRYPIFLLAFGPPIFRTEDIDATKGVVDIWSFLQAGLVSALAIRAIWRLAAAQSIFTPKQIRSILNLALFLGILFLFSTTYSPSRIVSAAYSLLYCLTMICVVEFVLDAYRNPPNWLQCLFHLRLIALLLFILALAVLYLNPELVLKIEPGAGVRFSGGTIGPVPLICPMIAIISAYAFLHSLESRVKSTLLFFVGLAGSLFTQSRGCELGLLLSLAFLVFFWARLGRRATFVFISGLMVSIFFSGMIVGSLGGERIWNFFNRGQDVRGIESASGRTDIWNYVIQYCIAHPWGMGYIAGFRMLFRNYYALGLELNVLYIGNAHNSYLQVLADAGWLALAIYLIIQVKIVRLALRFRKKQTYLGFASVNDSRMTIECSFIMLTYCLAAGIGTADFTIPLRAYFYWQYIIGAIILGISARMIVASRPLRSVLAE